MTKKLFIAEKPNVSKQLKSIYEPWAKYHSVSKYAGYYEGEEYIFTAASGHLFRIKEPQELNEEYQKWSMDQLPMDLPRDWPLMENTGERYDPAIFKMIKKLATRKDIDEIIVCTDPDREGQLIWGYIEEMLPPLKVKITRAWFKEWSPEVMAECVKNRKDNRLYANLEKAGRCRAIGDAIEGYNDSRAASCKFGSYKNIFSVGRVQTFTQSLVYEREKAILDFKPEDYSTLKLKCTSDSDSPLFLTHKTTKRLTKQEAEILKQNIMNSPSIVLHVDKKRKSQNVKKLYSTTEIQKEMNKRYGLSANETSDILQKTYGPDFALTTYPRTDVREISKSNADLHSRNAIENLLGCGIYDKEIQKVVDNNWTISSFVISKQETLAHEAITPVFGSISADRIKQLSTNEFKVSKAIIQRFLQAFYPKAIYDETLITGQSNDELFGAKGKTIIEEGFMEIEGKENDSLLPPITDGNTYQILDVEIEDKTTTPPARFTEATLLEAMENAGRFVEDKEEKETLKNTKGVGTGATRKETIKKLYTRKYIELKGKTIYPTQKTMEMMKVLPPTPLTSASSTAQMEILLDQIQDGSLSSDEYFNIVDERTEAFIDAVKKCDDIKIEDVTDESIGTCPICGNPVVKTKMGWGCSDWKNGCHFIIWEKVSGKRLTKSQAKQLLEKGTTDFISGFQPKDKSKKPFSAALTFKQENGMMNYEKMRFQFSKSSDYICPVCGENMEQGNGYLQCPKCHMRLWTTVSGKKLAKDDILSLLVYRKTKEIKGFTSKTGKKFSAKLYLDKNNQMKFDFSQDGIMTCPKCGKQIIEREKNYSCEGWKDGCKMTIWKNSFSKLGAKDITTKEAVKLFNGESIRMQFISKKGKPYHVYVKYNFETDKLDFEFENKN